MVFKRMRMTKEHLQKLNKNLKQFRLVIKNNLQLQNQIEFNNKIILKINLSHKKMIEYKPNNQMKRTNYQFKIINKMMDSLRVKINRIKKMIRLKLNQVTQMQMIIKMNNEVVYNI